MTNKTNLFLFLAISAIMIASPLVTDAFAAKKDIPNGKPFQALEESTARADSFFDVFFDVEAGATTPDSFFDIFVDVGEDGSESKPDSFFDIFVDIAESTARIDSFFDVWTEISVEERLDALDGPDGHVTVLKIQSPEGDADLQRQIDELKERLAALENPEPEPTCAECSNNLSANNRVCVEQFRSGEINGEEFEQCKALAETTYDECFASLSESEQLACAPDE